MKIELPQPLTCQAIRRDGTPCGYEWTPRIINVTICPRCKSAKWDVPKEEK